MTLQEIKDNYAKSEGYVDWDDLVNYKNKIGMEYHINHVMQQYAESYHEKLKKTYAMECLKKASENATVFLPSHYHLHGTKNVDKQSIHNENNLI